MRNRGPGRIWRTVGIILGSLLLIYYFLFALPFRGQPFNGKRHGTPPLTPEWALECWLWEDDDNTALRVDELLERMELTSRADDLVEKYSTGMKQRIAISKS